MTDKPVTMELVPQGASVPAAPGERPQDPMEILQFAIREKANVETLERVMAMRRELRAEEAKAAFDRAMADFQAECPIIKKETAGARGAYRYAKLDAIVEQTKAFIRKHGFSYSVTTVVEPGWCKAVLTITHAGGHSVTTEFKVPVDDKNPMMTEPQRIGGALTFAKRYAFCNGFGILTADEDRDGDTNRLKPPRPSSLHGDQKPSPAEAANKRKLIDLLRSVHGVASGYAMTEPALAKLTQYLVDEMYLGPDETVADLGGERLAKTVEKIQKKLNP